MKQRQACVQWSFLFSNSRGHFSFQTADRARFKPDLRVWHADGGGVQVGMSAAHRAAGITGEAHGVGSRSLARLPLKPALHVLAVLLLHPHALLDPPLGLAEGFFLQLPNQLGVELRLLPADIVQIADAVHVSLRGCHVQWRVVVVVQTPDVSPDGHEEGQAARVTVSRC